MQASQEKIDNYDHVIAYIWGSSGGGGRGVGHIALNLHLAEPRRDVFVSLWPGSEDKPLDWQYNFNVAFNAEHDHGPNTVIVFYTLDVLAMVARFNTLKMQTESWVMMPTRKQSLSADSAFHNCCTAAWNVLKVGGVYGAKGIFTENEFRSVVTTAKMKLPIDGSKEIPRGVAQFSNASSKGQDAHQLSMAGSGPSTLTWEAVLTGERYGPDFLVEILTKAKKKEVETMTLVNPADVRLKFHFSGHRNLFRREGYQDEHNQGAETDLALTAKMK